MLILMRHGQASFGAAHYDQLSDLGVTQSLTTGAYLHARSATCAEICIGPRERHRGTAQGLLQGWAIAPPQRHVDELDEFTTGTQVSRILQQGPGDAPGAAESTDLDARARRLMQRIGAWAAGELDLPGCPTLAQFRQRVGGWLRAEMAVTRQGPPVVAVTSGGTIAAAVCEVMSLPDSMFLAVVAQVRNASLTEFTLMAGQPALVSFNSTGHLPPVMLTTL